jgi:hypothetical protein
VIPWILITSFGLHTMLQTRYSLGMSLTTLQTSGHVLGRITKANQVGTFAALIVVILIFHFRIVSYESCLLLLHRVRLHRPFSPIGAATYLRKIAIPSEIVPSLAIGVTILDATRGRGPGGGGFHLNYVGYQIPFFIACGAAVITVLVTMRLNPLKQRTAGRVALDEAKLAAEAVAKTAH